MCADSSATSARIPDPAHSGGRALAWPMPWSVHDPSPWHRHWRSLALVFIALVADVGGQTTARAEGAAPFRWALDPQATVTAVAKLGNHLYVGGGFWEVFRTSGSGVAFDTRSGTPLAESPMVAGVINAVLPDGSGGWYVGGGFLGVGGQPRRYLAHLFANGTEDPRMPEPDAEVTSFALEDGVLYVGGLFGNVGGVPRQRLAAVNTRTGVLLPWRPSVHGDVRTLLAAHNRLFMSGFFDSVNATPRRYLAAVDTRTGLLLPWDPGADDIVHSLAVHGDTLYLGGRFRHISGQPRSLVAAVTILSGRLTPWEAPVRQFPLIRGYAAQVNKLLLDGDRLYVAGIFDHVGDAHREGLVALDRRTGGLLPWNPRLVGEFLPGYARALALDRNRLILGGFFASLGGVSGFAMAGAVDTETGDRVAWALTPNHMTNALAVSGDVGFAGGFFTSVTPATRRAQLAAFDLATGELLPWNPGADGGVLAMDTRDGIVYVGGRFQNVGGLPRAGVAAIDAETGVPTRWNPMCDRQVSSLAVTDSVVYCGGWYDAIGGAMRRNLAAVDRNTGLATPWNPDPDDTIHGIAVGKGAIYVSGWFTSVGGLRRVGVAAIDPGTGAPLPWRLRTTMSGDAIALADSVLLVGGTLVATATTDERRTTLAARVSTGDTLYTIPAVDDYIKTIVVHSGIAYVGGLFSSFGSPGRRGVAAFDVATGRVRDWDARLDGGVWALCADSLNLFVGGSFYQAGGRPAGLVAALPLESSTAILSHNLPPVLGFSATNPCATDGVVRFLLGSSASVNLSVYDLQGRRLEALVADQTMAPGLHQVPFRTTGWPIGCYFCTLEVAGTRYTGKVVVVR